MKRNISILVCFLVFIIGNSCQNQSKRIEPVLQKAESLLEQNPDSALISLHEISNPRKLRKELYYQYKLLEIQAKYKSYKDISSDSIVFVIRDYYMGRKNMEMLAYATFYSGRVFQEQKKYEKAIEQFLEAESYIQNSKDFNFKGLCQSAIGDVYYKQLMKDKAINRYKLAEQHYEQAGNSKNQIIANKFIGNCLLHLGKVDSAFFYYRNGLEMADNCKVESQQSEIRLGLGVAYRQIKDFERARLYFNEAMKFSKDSLNKAKVASNLANVYALEGKSDLAISQLKIALDLVPSNKNTSLKASIYKTWSTIEEKETNYQSALAKYKLFNKYFSRIINENKTSAILEIQEKFNFQLIENQNKQLKIERQRAMIFSLAMMVLAVLLILIFLSRTIRHQRKLNETEQKLFKMQAMAKNYNENENTFRNILIKHFDILKKAALLENYLNEDEKRKGERLLHKFNEVVYGQKNINWNLLFLTLNDTSNGFFHKLEIKLSNLDASEFRVCCLIYVGFNNTEIALFLGYRQNTVEVKKSLIRKKLGIANRGDIGDFLKSLA